MKEWTEIYEQMRGTFAQRAGFVPSEGCDSAVRLYALAAELQSLLMQADWVLDQSFPQTAQGMYLDYHAETRGITRAAAEKAVGTLRFAAADKVTAACPIEKGTVCMTAEGVRFETTEDATIAVGSQWADVPAQAVEAGAGGNVIAPTVETVAVTAALKAAPGYTFAEVKAGAQSALEALFTGGLLGKNVTTARLLTLLCGVEGVENVHLTAPAADVAVGSTELPMLGTVTISELTEA